MGKRILCISNDDMLMRTRELLLASAGYEVTSAWGFVEGTTHIRKENAYDLFLICHSVTPADKRALIEEFQATHDAPIIAIVSPDDVRPMPPGVIAHPCNDGPEALLLRINRMLDVRAVVADA